MKNKRVILRVGAALCAALIATIFCLSAFAVTYTRDVAISELQPGDKLSVNSGEFSTLSFDESSTLIFTPSNYGYIYHPTAYIGSYISVNGGASYSAPSGYPYRCITVTAYADSFYIVMGFAKEVSGGYSVNPVYGFSTNSPVFEIEGPPGDTFNVIAIQGRPVDPDVAYQEGYEAGYAEAEATYDGEALAFDGFAKIVTAPVDFVTRVLNFEILGVNIADLLKGIATVVIIVFIISKISFGG